MYVLKKVGLESENILLKLMNDSYKQAYENMHSQENIESYCKKSFTNKNIREFLSSNIYTCIIAYKENLPLGFFILKDNECIKALKGSALELQQLYILKSEYGKGLGKKLFDNAIEISKEQSIKNLWLYVSNTNERALAFYKKLGLEIIAEGKELVVGTDRFSSSIMLYKI